MVNSQLMLGGVKRGCASGRTVYLIIQHFIIQHSLDIFLLNFESVFFYFRKIASLEICLGPKDAHYQETTP